MSVRRKGRPSIKERFEAMPATKLDLFDVDKRLRAIENNLGLPSPPRRRFEPPKEGDDGYIP